jgi:hypothetical protein
VGGQILRETSRLDPVLMPEDANWFHGWTAPAWVPDAVIDSGSAW